MLSKWAVWHFVYLDLPVVAASFKYGLNFISIKKKYCTSRKFKRVVKTWIFLPRVIFIVDFKYKLRIKKNCILTRKRQFVHFCTFVRTYPIPFKVYQNIEDIILIKNHKRIVNIFSHFAKITIQNLEIANISKVTLRQKNYFSRLSTLWVPRYDSEGKTFKISKIWKKSYWLNNIEPRIIV